MTLHRHPYPLHRAYWARAEYDRRTALLVVDIQNDFADPAGSLYVEGGHEIVPVVNAEIAAAVAAEADVVYSADWHPPSTPHFKKDGGIWPVHCVHDTGRRVPPELDLAPSALVIHKGVGGEDGDDVQRPRPAERRDVGDRPRNELRERMIR